MARRTLTIRIIIGVIMTCFFIWIFFSLESPVAAHQKASQPETGYYATGPECNPKSLAAIPLSADRQNKTRECADKREDHRLKQADLVQQTRAANGAMGAAILAFDQTRLAFVGTVLSALTTVMLIWTIYKTRRTASISQAQVRAYLTPHVGFFHTVDGKFDASFKLKNMGQSPAMGVTVRIGCQTVSIDEFGRALMSYKKGGSKLSDASPETTIAPGRKQIIQSVMVGMCDPEIKDFTIAFDVVISSKDIFGQTHTQEYRALTARIFENCLDMRAYRESIPLRFFQTTEHEPVGAKGIFMGTSDAEYRAQKNEQKLNRKYAPS